MKQIISGEEVQGKQFVVDVLTDFVEEKTQPFQAENKRLLEEKEQIVEAKDNEIRLLRDRLDQGAAQASISDSILADKQSEIESLSAGNRELEDKVHSLDLESKRSLIDAKVEAYSNVVRVVIVSLFVIGLVFLVKFIIQGAQNWRDGIVAAIINIPGLVELFFHRILKNNIISRLIRWAVSR